MTQKEKEIRLKHAMMPLLADTRFAEFINAVRDLKEEAVANAILDETVRNKRIARAAIGEIRCYRDIIGIYENFLEQAEQEKIRLDEEREAAS